MLWRAAENDSIEIAGVYRPGAGNWSLPKGKLRNGEHRLLAACREVEEETGLTPIPQTYLTSARYALSRPGGDVVKTVDFWSMRTSRPDADFTPSGEVTMQRWMPLEEAVTTLTRPRDQQTLKAFRSLPRITSTVILIRHARAVPEGPGGRDAARPLDTMGRGQAAAVLPLLALYAPRGMITASPLRCVETIGPLAAALDVQLEEDSLFDAEKHLGDPERAVRRLRELGSAGGTTVVCSQEPVIVDSLAILADADDVSVCDVHTPPAGTWVLSFAGPKLAAVERL